MKRFLLICTVLFCLPFTTWGKGSGKYLVQWTAKKKGSFHATWTYTHKDPFHQEQRKVTMEWKPQSDFQGTGQMKVTILALYQMTKTPESQVVVSYKKGRPVQVKVRSFKPNSTAKDVQWMKDYQQKFFTNAVKSLPYSIQVQPGTPFFLSNQGVFRLPTRTAPMVHPELPTTPTKVKTKYTPKSPLPFLRREGRLMVNEKGEANLKLELAKGSKSRFTWKGKGKSSFKETIYENRKKKKGKLGSRKVSEKLSVQYDFSTKGYLEKSKTSYTFKSSTAMKGGGKKDFLQIKEEWKIKWKD